MKKILFLTSNYLPLPSANGIIVDYLIQNIKEEYDVSCLAIKRSNENNFERIDEIDIYRIETTNFMKNYQNKNIILKYLILIHRYLLKVLKIFKFPNFDESQNLKVKRTTIENDVWIGNNCLIKSGIKIENGAVIGMGSVLTRDVGPYEIWAGNPAKLIKKRFMEKEIELLLTSKWWKYDERALYEAGKTFNELKYFIKNKGEY